MKRRKRRRQRGAGKDGGGFPEGLKEPVNDNPNNQIIKRPICAPGGNPAKCMAGGCMLGGAKKKYAPVLQDVKNYHEALPQKLPVPPPGPDYEADWWHPNEPPRTGGTRRRRRRSSRHRRTRYHRKSRRRRRRSRRRRYSRRRYRKKI